MAVMVPLAWSSAEGTPDSWWSLNSAPPSPEPITLVAFRGTTPDGTWAIRQRDAFRAAGSPSSYATGCLVNYGWLMKYHQGEDWGPLMVFTSSVRHFTPAGAMTEVCAPSIPANILP